MFAYLQFVSYHLPAAVLSNDDIAKMHPEWSIEKISEKTGINLRHICAENETGYDLALDACRKLFIEHDVDKNSIDYIIYCTQSPDYFLPTTACVLQNALDLSKNCGALDFNLGCSGYVYGLGLAKGLIYSGQAKNVLLVTAETYSKYIHSDDKSNKTIFGDAATASLVTKDRVENGLNANIKEFKYGTDGSGYDNLIVFNGASRNPDKNGFDIIDENGGVRNMNNLFMDGKAIFNFTAFQIPNLIKATLVLNNLSLQEIDLFIFHQANAYMLNVVRTRCNIDKEKFYLNFSDVGNTVSSTIPIAINRAMNAGVFLDKKYVLLAGFGVGLSMGATILEFQTNINDTI